MLSSLFEPIKADLHLSDAQLGVLGGLAVALFGALFGVHIARLADRRPQRREVLVVCLVAWSVATASSGAAPGFYSLLAARIAVGVGEAGCIPISLAIIADAYPQKRRSQAMSIYYMGLPGGIMLGLFLGGWLAQSVGWRTGFLAGGIPGLALSLRRATRLREPPRGFSDAGEGGDGARLLGHGDASPVPAPPRLKAQLLSIARCRTFVYVLLGGSLSLFTAIGTFAFMPSLCARRFATAAGVTGSALSAVMLFGALCTLAGGAACDAAFRRTGSLGVYAALPAGAVALGVPFGVALCVAPSFGATIALFLVPTLSANVPSGPLRCLVSALVPAHNRAAANSVLEIGIGLAGGLGPLTVGALSDDLQRRGYTPALALSRAMLAIQLVAIPAALCLWRAAVNAAADAREREQRLMQEAVRDPPAETRTPTEAES